MFQALCYSSLLHRYHPWVVVRGPCLYLTYNAVDKMMMWTDSTHVLAAQMKETTIRVLCDTCHKQLRCAKLSRKHQEQRGEPIPQAVRQTHPRISRRMSHRCRCPLEWPSLPPHFGRCAWALAMRCMCSLCMALCHAFLFACTPLQRRMPLHDLRVFIRPSRNACSSRSMAVAVLVRTCALPRFDRALRERAAVSLATRCSS